MLDNLVMLIAAMSAIGLSRMVRRRLWWDAPMGLILAALVGLGIAALAGGPHAELFAIIVVLAGLVLGNVPFLFDQLAVWARVRRSFRVATGWRLVSLILQPSARQQACFRAERALSRVARGSLGIQDAAGRIEALVPVAERVRDVGLSLALLETRVAIGAAAGRWDLIADRLLPEHVPALVTPPNGAGSYVVEALCRAGRRGEAAAIVAAMEAHVPRRLVPSLSDAFRNRSRLALLAWCGRRVEVEAALARGSSLRVLFGRQEREELLGVASRAAAPEDPDLQAIVELAAGRLAIEARLANPASHFGRPAAATGTLLAVIVAIYVWMALTGRLDSMLDYLRLGACLPELVRSGDIWRLFTATFLHAGVLHIHILFNGGSLLYFGNIAERILGPWRLLVVYALSGLAGSAAYLLLGGSQLMVGASGAIFGLFGACLTIVVRLRHELPRTWVRRNTSVFVALLVFNVLLGSLVENISLSAHMGGLVMGGLVTLGLLGPRRPRLDASVAIALWSTLLIWSALGLADTARRPVGDLIPTQSRVVTVWSPGGEDRAQVVVTYPTFWQVKARSRPGGEGFGPALIGPSAQLNAIEVTCRSNLPVAWRHLPSGDGAALAGWLAELPPGDGDDALPWTEYAAGAGGFALKQRRQDAFVQVSATRVDERGRITLWLWFDVTRGDAILGMLDPILAGTRIQGCR